MLLRPLWERSSLGPFEEGELERGLWLQKKRAVVNLFVESWWAFHSRGNITCLQHWRQPGDGQSASKLVQACPHLPSKLSGYKAMKQDKERDNKELQLNRYLNKPRKGATSPQKFQKGISKLYPGKRMNKKPSRPLDPSTAWMPMTTAGYRRHLLHISGKYSVKGKLSNI